MPDTRKPLLEIGQHLHGFTVEGVEPLAEIDGRAYLMRHDVSGTPLMWLANDDENMSFSIAFKTPPADDTGVFHILEHSVLCGSDRFPVKEPFVNLLKTSMQTFLNAMTYSDKTLYPVASTNEQDLLNLMDVYMDAVLHPLLHSKRQVFEQEGWHLELDDVDGPIRYNGVVLNEMKGALGNPDDVVLNGLNAAIFPDSAYRFESGGAPRAIPTLTYEAYRDAHRRHYNLANAHIILYGDMGLDRELELLDERYLSCAEAPLGAPNPLDLQPPVVDMDHTVTMETEPSNRSVALGYVVGTFRDRLDCLACEVLVDALMGSNEAPLKDFLLRQDLGDDVDAFLYDGLQQPYVVMELRGAAEGSAARFAELVHDELARMADEGIPRDKLEASLDALAFSLKERDWGYADGVALAASAMSGWLYDDAMPLDYLRYEEPLAQLRANLEGRWWEDLLRRVLVDSRHHAACELIPIEPGSAEGAAAQEAAELETLKASMGAGELEDLARATIAFHEAQDAPDTPEALATLPRLRITDIGPARPMTRSRLMDDSPLPCMWHDIPTHGIAYVNHYFDLTGLNWEELPAVTLLCSLLTKMPTDAHDASELDTLLESKLGRLGFGVVTYDDTTSDIAVPRVMVNASALYENMGYLVDLPREVWRSSRFDDLERIHTILTQTRLDMEQGFITGGHSYALARAQSYTDRSSLLAGRFGGIEYYRYVRSLLDSWDETSRDLPAMLTALAEKIFRRGKDHHSFTGTIEAAGDFWELAGTLDLPEADPIIRLRVPEPRVLREGFAIPSDICFVSKACDPATSGNVYGGAWMVASKAINYDYLWNEIRVKGGAYGCGLKASNTGALAYYTYRDPNLDASVGRMDAAGSWLAAIDPAEDEMCGYIVSAVAALDAPRKPAIAARVMDQRYLSHRPDDWTLILREQILNTTPEDLKGLAPMLDAVAARDALCVWGGRDILEASTAGLTIVDLMA